MGANADNAILFLVTTLFDLAMWLLLLRILLQWVRADFYNPMSQLVWQTTRYPTDWVRKVLPRWRNLDTAALAVLFVLTTIYVYSTVALLGLDIDLPNALIDATLKILVLTVNLYTFTLFVQAILSWLGPGVNNPASNVLWSLNEPMLRPVRRLIPPVAGLDLAPLVLMLLLQVVARLIPLPGLFR